MTSTFIPRNETYAKKSFYLNSYDILILKLHYSSYELEPLYLPFTETSWINCLYEVNTLTL